MIYNSDPVSKTRNLPLSDFFEKLQEEYIVAELRKKIYPKARDKEFYGKVMEFKKEKIKDIVLRNCLPSIFTSEVLRQRCYHNIYKNSGFPNFIYKDEYERDQLEIFDRINYYEINTDIKIDVAGEVDIKFGRIVDVDFNLKKVLVEEKSKKYWVDIQDVTRII